MKKLFTILLLLFPLTIVAQGLSQYVDPLIGSEGLGRVFIGPSCPFGMVKPGPDCGVSNNAGWSKDGELSGFSQTHVSGTGGGPKYGNILIAPHPPKGATERQLSLRTNEEVKLGYYACTLENGIKTEITAAERAAFYQFSGVDSIEFDLQHFLGKTPVPKAREAQQYEDSELNVVNDSVTTGWQCISGGWNNGAPYTVYFYALQKKDKTDILLKIGISFVSIEQAKRNLIEDIPHWDFQRTYEECIQKWETELSKVQLAENTPIEQKRMFYTALYHTMLMPVDRTERKTPSPALPLNGEGDQQYSRPDGSPLKGGDVEVRDRGGLLYDDYYAIWDTYRTSTPLLSIINPERETAIANGLLNIYKKTGYMPDARSGNSNGRTQGGSNAEIVIADALAKGLKLDYNLALEAMLKDATVPPKDDEAEGRGGLEEYNTLGYIPFGIPRAGNRTVEYAFCDWAIAEVAKHLGKKELSAQYQKQSERWKNLWNNDYSESGIRGFILPKDKKGEWVYKAPFGHSKLHPQTFLYEPRLSYEGPWYCAWWSCFMYEASSWEYSFSIPHDIPGLIKMCGGKKAFEHRLDRFFELGHYNIANEPSFLTPCLYHWIGRPDKTNARLAQILPNYNASAMGIPGNDDSGAMSSWLAFHMMGLYPNAGHDYYLVHRPILKETVLNLANGKTLRIVSKKGKKDKATLNGRKLKNMFLTHKQLMKGGELTIYYTDTTNLKDIPQVVPSKQEEPMQYQVTCFLHGQKRNFKVSFEESDTPHPSTLILKWGIQRNLKWWKGIYRIHKEARQHAKRLCYDQPFDGKHLDILRDEIFCWLLSQDMLRDLKATQLDADTTVEIQGHTYPLIHHIDSEGTEMWVVDNPDLPLIWKMHNNANEIDWEMSVLNETF